MQDPFLTEWRLLHRFDYDTAVARLAAAPANAIDETVNEPFLTLDCQRAMLERVDNFVARGWPRAHVFPVAYGAQWDSIVPDNAGNHDIDHRWC